jgi:hypothetical protein
VYVRRTPRDDQEDSLVILPLYVDDALAATNDSTYFASFVSKLESELVITYDGNPHTMLSMCITHNRDQRIITLDQTAYINSIINEFNMARANPVVTPYAPGSHLSAADCPTSEEEKERMKSYPYLRLLGKLMYAALCTRPDLSYSLSILTCFSSNPAMVHWTALKHVVRYLI